MTASKPPSIANSASWIVMILCFLAIVYVMLATYALDLGAAHHDAFCPEHGWAA